MGCQAPALPWCYDDKVFRSVWQDYRVNTANDTDALRVISKRPANLAFTHSFEL